MKTSEAMVVDDETANLELAAVMLASFGYRVTQCANGQEAVEECRTRAAAGQPTFALILMDLHMPLMNGIEATRILRTLDCAVGVPILCVTGDTSSAAREQAIASGCMAVLYKPYRRHHLAAALAGAGALPAGRP